MLTISPIVSGNFSEKENNIISLWNNVINATNERQYMEVLQYLTKIEIYVINNYESMMGLRMSDFLIKDEATFLTDRPEYKRTLDVLHLLMPDIFSYYDGERLPACFSTEDPQDKVKEQLANLQNTVTAFFIEKRKKSSQATQLKFFQESSIVNNYMARDLLLQYKTLFEQWKTTLLAEPEDDIDIAYHLQKNREILLQADSVQNEYKATATIFEKHFDIMPGIYSSWKTSHSTLSEAMNNQTQFTESSQENIKKSNRALINLSLFDYNLDKLKKLLDKKSSLEELILSTKKAMEFYDEKIKSHIESHYNISENSKKSKDILAEKHSQLKHIDADISDLENDIAKTITQMEVTNKKMSFSSGKIGNLADNASNVLQAITEKMSFSSEKIGNLANNASNVFQAITEKMSFSSEKIGNLADNASNVLQAITEKMSFSSEKIGNLADKASNVFQDELEKTDSPLNIFYELKNQKNQEKEAIAEEITEYEGKIVSCEEELLSLTKQNTEACEEKIKLEALLKNYQEIQEVTRRELEMQPKLESSEISPNDISRKREEIARKKSEEEVILQQHLKNEKEQNGKLRQAIEGKKTLLSDAEKKLTAAISDLESILLTMGYNIEYSAENLDCSQRYQQIMQIAQHAHEKEALYIIEKTPERIPALTEISQLEKQLQAKSQNNADLSIPQRLALVLNAKTIIDDQNLSVPDKVHMLNKDLNTLKTAQQNTLSQQEISFLTQAGLLLGCLVLVTPIACAISKITRGTWAFWKSNKTIEQTHLCQRTEALLQNKLVPPVGTSTPVASTA